MTSAVRWASQEERAYRFKNEYPDFFCQILILHPTKTLQSNLTYCLIKIKHCLFKHPRVRQWKMYFLKWSFTKSPILIFSAFWPIWTITPIKGRTSGFSSHSALTSHGEKMERPATALWETQPCEGALTTQKRLIFKIP